MQHTANLKLNKPELTDYVNIEDLNENMDIIDNAFGELETELVIERFDVPGTYTWTIPEGVTKVYISGCGGGGSGRGNNVGLAGGLTSFGSYVSLSGGAGGGTLSGGDAGGFGAEAGTIAKGGSSLFGIGGERQRVSVAGIGYGSGSGQTNSGTNNAQFIGGGGGECIIKNEIAVYPTEDITITIGGGGSSRSDGNYGSGKGGDGLLLIEYIK